MYKWVVFLHVFGSMSFMLSHGGSTIMAFVLRKERSKERMKALLDLSGYSWAAFALTFLVLLASGIAAGILGRWWGQGWIWTSLGILLAMSVYMGWASRAQYHKLRKVLGMPYFEGRGDQPALEPASDEEINAAQEALQPGLLGVIGLGSTAVIVFLMMFKPF
jgi:hypothetical protein